MLARIMDLSPERLSTLRRDLDAWAAQLGFSAVAVSAPDLAQASERLRLWLDEKRHGDMAWLERSHALRSQPDCLHPGTIRVISTLLPYPGDGAAADSTAVLQDRRAGFISRYALGRDYHRVMRSRLAQLARRLADASGGEPGRAFCDSAPVMEVELARQAGLGWRGKHTLLLNRQSGSWFFLGEIYTDLPLAVDTAMEDHCGRCTACLDACPTGAIVAPYQIDARLCVSYLTIEHAGSIPLALRPLMGNRIYGCDDCQLCCPWNREGPRAVVADDFAPRSALIRPDLASLLDWSEAEFEQRLQGSAIRRIGHRRWLRNVAVALGNGPADSRAIQALLARNEHPDAMVREHVVWALTRLTGSGHPSSAVASADPIQEERSS